MAHKQIVNLLLEDAIDDSMVLSAIKLLKDKPKRKHRFWVHDILKKRDTFGAFQHFVGDLELHSTKYQEYFRLSMTQMQVVLEAVGPTITKKYVTREPICAKQRLAICIR